MSRQVPPGSRSIARKMAMSRPMRAAALASNLSTLPGRVKSLRRCHLRLEAAPTIQPHRIESGIIGSVETQRASVQKLLLKTPRPFKDLHKI